MIKKEIDLNALLKNSLTKAYAQHGLLSEAEIETTSLYGSMPTPAFKSTKVGQKGSEEALEIDYVLDTFATDRSIESVNQIISGINKAIGIREMKFAGASQAADDTADEEGKTNKTNVRELASAIYLVNLFNLIISQQRPQASGYIFESLVARMVGGTLPAGTSTPIQDVVDSKGRYISVKVLAGKAEGVKGSKLGLAKAILNKGVVTYFVAVKSETTSPFKINFYKFDLNKENYFQFITNDPDAVDEGGNLAGEALEYSKIINKKAKEAKKKNPKTIEESISRIRNINTIYFDLYNGNIEEITRARQEKIKEINDLVITPENLESFKTVFAQFLDNEDRVIQFPITRRKVDVTNEADFKQSLIDLLFPKEKSAKLLNQTIFDNFFTPKFFDLNYNGDDKQHNVKTYDFLPPNRQAPPDDKPIKRLNFPAFKQQLEKRNEDFKNTISKIISDNKAALGNKKYEEYSFYEYVVNTKLFNDIAAAANEKGFSELKVAIENEYMFRSTNIYRKEYAQAIEVYKSAFGPIMSWFDQLIQDAKKEEEKIKTSNSQKISTRSQSPQGDATIKSFFDNVKTISSTSLDESLLKEEQAGPKSTYTQFLNKFSDLFELGITIDDNFEELIISLADSKQVSSKNSKILRTYLEKYFDYFDNLKKDTDLYFIKDNEKSIINVSKTLEDFKKFVDATYIESGVAKKASELKEDLNNLSEEAKIVMEMLEKMEG